MPESRDLAPGTIVAGEWRIERSLGEGGFGITYEARNQRTGARVALKEYMPSGCCTRVAGSSHVTAAAGREGEVFRWGRERFMKEAETLARLDHSSIVRVESAFEANGTAYMALGYEAGGTVGSWLKRLCRPPSEAELDRLLWPLLDALTQVHALFLLHRDIKPDNIMLRTDATPVLIDFGAVRSAIVSHTTMLGGVNPAATSAFAIVSHGFSPPEQYDPAGAMMGPASDVYALGATLHYALVGEPPPAGPSRVFGDSYVPLARRLQGRGLRAELLAGIDKSLAANPRERPQSAMEMRRALAVAPPAAAAPGRAEAGPVDRGRAEPSTGDGRRRQEAAAPAARAREADAIEDRETKLAAERVEVPANAAPPIERLPTPREEPPRRQRAAPAATPERWGADPAHVAARPVRDAFARNEGEERRAGQPVREVTFSDLARVPSSEADQGRMSPLLKLLCVLGFLIAGYGVYLVLGGQPVGGGDAAPPTATTPPPAPPAPPQLTAPPVEVPLSPRPTPPSVAPPKTVPPPKAPPKNPAPKQ